MPAHLFYQYLEQNSLLREPKSLYEPADYILQLGGKRLRPQLLLMSYQLFRSDVERALSAAFSIEIFHNFSLVHDDIMDKADVRRGKPTVHVKYGTNAGILSGDAMLILAYQHLAKCESSFLSQILDIFNKFALQVCEGQQYDVDFEQRADVTIPEYLRMIELKTAVLLAGAMQIGAVLANASSEEAQHLYEFGRNIGIAFQLQDDILDTFGDAATFGKKIGGDISQNKKTFLVLKALEIAGEKSKAELLFQLSTPTIDDNEAQKIETVTQIFKKLDILQLANVVKNGYQQAAFGHLDALKVPEERKQALRDLAAEMLVRVI